MLLGIGASRASGLGKSRSSLRRGGAKAVSIFTLMDLLSTTITHPVLLKLLTVSKNLKLEPFLTVL